MKTGALAIPFSKFREFHPFRRMRHDRNTGFSRAQGPVLGFAVVGLAALLLTGLIAWPVRQPPELTSISDARKSVDFSALPAGQPLPGPRRHRTGLPALSCARRRRPGASPSSCMARRARAEARSTCCPAPWRRGAWKPTRVDIRGHGASGTRGDIAYLGQLEDDLADLVGEIRKTNPTAPLTLIGHSSAAGSRCASPARRSRTCSPAPCCWRPISATTRRAAVRDSGGWANPDIPRFIALTVLRRLGIVCANRCRPLASRCRRIPAQILTATYSYRLMRNFGSSRDYPRRSRRGDQAGRRSSPAPPTN